MGMVGESIFLYARLLCFTGRRGSVKSGLVSNGNIDGDTQPIYQNHRYDAEVETWLRNTRQQKLR